MESEQVKVGKFYSLGTGTMDTVIVTEILGDSVYFDYAYWTDAYIFRDIRNLPIEVFMKCYEPNKMCDVLFGEK